MSKEKTKRTAIGIHYQKDGYLFVFPIVFMLAALILYPMIMGFISAFLTQI